MHNIQHIDFKVNDLKEVKILWRKNDDKNLEHMKVHKLRNKTLEKKKRRKEQDLWFVNKNENKAL